MLNQGGSSLEVEWGCGYFKWYDPSMCDRAKQLLNQFRDCERKLNKENLALRRQISKEPGRLRNEESGSSVGTRLEVNFDGEMDSKRDMEETEMKRFSC
ncbi:hypothetical protein PTKIN_Ptkin01aG0274300 [Pterospermum kingtungense]